MTAGAPYSKPLLLWLSIFYFGALWGSFFYTLALRYMSPKLRKNLKQFLLLPSHCTSCGGRISIVGLIPVVGYLLNRGKCSRCGSLIPPAYPVSEILFGVLSTVVAYKSGISMLSLITFLILGLAAVISIIDIRTLVVPNSLVFAILVLSIYPVIVRDNLPGNLMGALGMFLFFILVLFIFPGSFGGGDVKFATVIGFLMGGDYSIIVMEIALITGSLTGIAYAFIMKKNLRIKIPFAPFLSLGLLCASLYGREIILFYTGMFY